MGSYSKKKTMSWKDCTTWKLSLLKSGEVVYTKEASKLQIKEKKIHIFFLAPKARNCILNLHQEDVHIASIAFESTFFQPIATTPIAVQLCKKYIIITLNHNDVENMLSQ